MSHQIDLDQVMGQANATWHNVQTLVAELQRFRETVKQLTEERERLPKELAEVRSERDEYATAVHYLTRRETAITVEDIEEAERAGITLDQIIALLEPGESVNAVQPS
jgi:uncharacterized coiled-coil DUF342 family protein